MARRAIFRRRWLTQHQPRRRIARFNPAWPGPIREFDGAGGTKITVSAGGVATLTPSAHAVTLAFLWKPTATSDDGLIRIEDASNNGIYAVNTFGGNLFLSVFGDGFDTSAHTYAATDGWRIDVVTRASGFGGQVRWHGYRRDVGTWVHANGGTKNDPNVAGAVDEIHLGFMDGSNSLAGRLAAVGVWMSALSDGNIETLPASLQAWKDLTPAALWRFNQSSTATAVTDLMGGGADETADVGTSVVNDAPFGFDFTTTGTTYSASGTVTGTGAFTGTEALTIGVSGTVAGTGAASGTEALTIPVAGSVAGTGAASGTEALIIGQTGTVAGTGAASGTEALTIGVTGSVAGSGAASGTESLDLPASGSTGGTGAFTGTEVLTIPVAGTVAGTGAFTGTATVVGQTEVDGTVTGTGAATGTEVLTIGVSGTVAGTGAATGTATITGSGTVSLDGTVGGTGGFSAALSRARSQGSWLALQAVIDESRALAAEGDPRLLDAYLPFIEDTTPAAGAGAGPWFNLQSTLREARVARTQDKALALVACPNDGEPLQTSPDGRGLFCPYDGYRAPAG